MLEFHLVSSKITIMTLMKLSLNTMLRFQFLNWITKFKMQLLFKLRPGDDGLRQQTVQKYPTSSNSQTTTIRYDHAVIHSSK